MAVDYKAAAARILPRARELVPQWLPGGHFEGPEYSCASLSGGKGRSCKINTETGAWSDFSTGDKGGDIIDLYAKIHNIKSYEAIKILMPDFLKPQTMTKVEVTPVKKPADIEPPNFTHYRYGEPQFVWTYKDTDGSDIYYIARYWDSESDKKQIVPWVWCSTSNQWKNRQFAKDKRPIYNLDLITKNPDKPILIVEGEKAAEAAMKLTKAYIVTTWTGGGNAVDKNDWSPIYGRKVLLWPDFDEPGFKAVAWLSGMLYSRCPEVKNLNIPRNENLTKGFDAADLLDLGLHFSTWAKPFVKLIEKQSEPAPQATVGNFPTNNDNFNGPPGYLQSSIGIQYSFPNTGSKGKIKSTYDNFKHLINNISVVVRYNVIKKTEEILIPGQTFSIDNMANASLAHLTSEAHMMEFPTSNIGEYVTLMADKNPYNPIATWITSKPWDGKSRIQALYDTVKSTDDKLKEMLMRRWFISAVAAAFQPNGISAHGVLVFQGDQEIGKTFWFKRLVPRELEATADGMILDPSDKDSVKQICSYWLVELGELDATFKRADMARLKAFITKDRDKLRAAFAKRESEYARRTVFFGSVNPDDFLNDDENRRFWVVECLSIDNTHQLDMQQLWAEFYEIYKSGEQWTLKPDERIVLKNSNEYFKVREPIVERIQSEFDWNSNEQNWTWKTVTQVCQDMGIGNVSKFDLNKASSAIARLNGKQRRRTGIQRLVLMPPRLGQNPILP